MSVAKLTDVQMHILLFSWLTVKLDTSVAMAQSKQINILNILSI